MHTALIRGAIELPHTRRTTDTTAQWLARAFDAVLRQHGLSADDIDGLGVASFTLKPDRCIDMAWRLGLRLSWSMDDSNGGVSGLNLLQHAVAAIRTGQARHIVLLAGDVFQAQDFADLAANYNRTTQQLLRPLGIANPNALFALLTQRHMALHGLQRQDYGRLVTLQRRHAQRNPQAVYRDPMSLDDYLAAPLVAEPLGLFDCVPVVAGADAILLSRADAVTDTRGCVQVKALRALHNGDRHEGDGLRTGLHGIAPALYADAGLQPAQIDLACVYDDFPVMALAQLDDLGLAGDRGLVHFVRKKMDGGRLAINTSGGQLSVGQAGCAGGMHGLVEAIRQLGGQAGDRQLPQARTALVSGYGMVQYRYGLCANAAILEAL